MIQEALNVTPSQFSLVYNKPLGVITGNINFLSESLLGSETMTIGKEFGGLANIQTSSKIDLWRRAEGAFGFGIDLSPFGTGFSITDSTLLSSLPSWGKGIDATKPADLKITMSDGAVFSVDLGTASNIGNVRNLIAQASVNAGVPRVAVTINAASNGLVIQDLLFPTAGNPVSRFKVDASNGSFAGVILGLTGEDDDDNGQIIGRALHGESLANRFYVKDFNVNLLVQATASDIDATADFGIVNVGIQNGKGEATATLNLTLRDPNSDGRIYLSEMTALDLTKASDLATIIGTPNLECDLNLELPIVLNSSIAGLTLPNNAAVIVSWAEIHDGTDPIVHLRGLDNLKGFENFSAFGLSLDLPVSRAIDASLDVKTNLPEISVRLRGELAPINLDLSYIDPTATGPALKSILSFRDLGDAFRLQTSGKLTLNFSDDGRSVVLYDNTTGTGTFQVNALNGSSILSQLGLSGIASMDGKIAGNPIYQPSVLDALRRVVELLRSFESVDGLSQPIPGTTVSINDLLDFADKLDATLTELQDKPASALQGLEQALESGLGVAGTNLALKLDGNALKIVVRLGASRSESIGLNFELNETLGQFVNASSAGRVNAVVGSDFVLAMGIDLTDPEDLRPFLYTSGTGTNLIDQGTKLDVTALVSTPTPINMSVAIGPLGAHIVNGFIKLDQDGSGPLTAPARLTATLKNTNGSGRRYLDQLSLNSLQYSFVGRMDASLPVYMPTNDPGDLVGPITLTANLQDPINSFDVSLPDFTEALDNVNFDTDLTAFLDGWDSAQFVRTKNRRQTRWYQAADHWQSTW